ncbi:MAG: hypothetical protein AAGC99_12535 [Pseudomonadota bacterium]
MINPSVSMIHLQLPMERRELELTSKTAEDLIAYAEGHTLDPETNDPLDRWLFDYADCDLEDEYIDVADDLEALMRRNRDVAMLVAGKIEEKRLHKRICAYAHDWLYGKEEAEIKRLIESNRRLFDLVERLRLLVPDTEAAFRTLEDEPRSLELLPIIRTLTSQAPDCDPPRG